MHGSIPLVPTIGDDLSAELRYPGAGDAARRGEWADGLHVCGSTGLTERRGMSDGSRQRLPSRTLGPMQWAARFGIKIG